MILLGMYILIGNLKLYLFIYLCGRRGCMPVHRSHRASAVRRPLAGVGFLSLLCGSRDRTQFIRLSHRHLHLLSHPAGPVLRIFFFLLGYILC